MFNKLVVLGGLILAVMSGQSWAATDQSSFTPTSIKVPIRGIYLHSSTDNQGAEIYNCSGDSEADCLVDVASQTELDNLINTAEITTGTYDQIQVSTCKDEGEYNAQIKGAVTLGSTSYVTDSGDQPLKTTGDADYATVTFTGCSKNYDLPTDLTVVEGETVSVKLFVALTNIAWGKTGAVTVPSGCIAGTGDSFSVCMAYPDVAAYIGTASPTVETYHLSEGSGAAESAAAGQLIIMFDADDNLIGGMSRRLFSETSVSMGTNFDTPLRRITKLDGGNLDLENFGSSADDYYFKIDSFPRSTHSGNYNDISAPTTDQPYEAYKQ
ncbi:hypothetical protein HOH87_00260 [bacterium]|jgi:hypothetical protein|nr:hypothetical protein [bacterium]